MRVARDTIEKTGLDAPPVYKPVSLITQQAPVSYTVRLPWVGR